MDQTIPFLSNNEAFNPLYAKMKERFSSNGTVAEQMAAQAKVYMKKSHRPSSEYHMTHANSLPKPTAKKKRVSLCRSIFNLRRVGVACMSLLVAGTVAFSGFALGKSGTNVPSPVSYAEEATSFEDNAFFAADASFYETVSVQEDLAHQS